LRAEIIYLVEREEERDEIVRAVFVLGGHPGVMERLNGQCSYRTCGMLAVPSTSEQYMKTADVCLSVKVTCCGL